MPEYSTPKLTPDETTKLPGMNGSSSGYVLTSELLDIIRSTYGQANGVATLDSSGKLPTAQLPDIADDVLVYASKALLPAQGVEAKIYITTDDNVLYRWDATLGDYVQLSVDLSDYATLDDLAAEESARETADTNLNDALSAHEKRIENLEEAHGSYHEVDVKSVYTIPTGKGSNWLIEGLRGVSRVENNLVAPSNLRTREAYGVTITANADGTITVNGTAQASTNLDFTLTNFGTVGHSYVVCGGKSNGKIVINDGTHFATDSGAGAYLANTTGTVKLQFPISNGVTYNVTITPCVTDLNIYFNGTIPSDASTIAEIQTNYPWLLTPSDYGTSAVNTVYEGIRSKARNLWDEVWEVGSIDSSGQPITANDQIRSKNYTAVKPNTAYYFHIPNTWLEGYWYDANKNFVSRFATDASPFGLRTSPSNAYFCKFRTSTTYGNTYHDNICINQSDSQNGTYTPYWSPVTLTLPEPVTLKEAGSVADTDELNVKVDGVARRRQTQRVTTYSFTASEGWAWDASGFWYMSGYTEKSKFDTVMASNGIFVRTYTNSNIVRVYSVDNPSVTSSTTMNTLFKSGTTMSYALYTEVVTLSDPILDNLIKTEPGGTIESILTTPVDDSMTLGYINL